MSATRFLLLAVCISVSLGISQVKPLNVDDSLGPYARIAKQLQADNIPDLLIKIAMQSSNISKLEYLCDTFGPRWPGTANLENAIDWILATMNAEGLQVSS
jgi:hypothetical protein